MYQCTDHHSTKACNWSNIGAGFIPATGYTSYAVDISVDLIAHDGDANDMQARVTVTICSGGNCDSFLRSGSPPTPKERYTANAWSGTIQVQAAGPPQVSISTFIEEATTKTTLTVRAIP